MASNQNLQTKLRDGIEAARRGDKIAARRLLQQVLIADKNNEIALMWMASVADTVEDRRAYLRRVLQINPRSERAREALTRLGETPPPLTATTPGARRDAPPPVPPAYTPPQKPRGLNVYLIAALLVGAVVLIVALVSLRGGFSTPVNANATATQFVNQEATFNALVAQNSTATPTSDLPPTATLLPGIIVTFNPDALEQLPPTFTPTFTHTPPPTATLAPTSVPASAYEIVFSDFDPGLGRGSLYIGDVQTAQRVGSNEQAFDEVAYDPNNAQIAFLRPVYYEPQGDVGEIFAQEIYVAPLANPDDAVQVTELKTVRIVQPQWSPDGTRILFSAEVEGDEEIFMMNADGSAVVQLTDNANVDTGARFRFDGVIVFASDAETPGFMEIFTMQPDGTQVTRLSNHPGNSYAPAFSPDGTRIAYINDQGGDGDVYIMDADGQRPFLLTTDDRGAEDRTPVWSPDSRWIAFSSNRQADIFGWYATDLRGTITPIIPPSLRIPQTLNFIALKGE